MQEENVDRILYPCDLKPAPLKRAQLVNIAARMVTFKFFLLDPADHALDYWFGSNRHLLGADQIVGLAVKRITIILGRHEAAVEHWLVIAGKQNFRHLCAGARRDQFETRVNFPRQTRRARPMDQ